MATEILAVPEENLAEVIRVIRAGLRHVDGTGLSQDTRDNLTQWCNEEQAYLERVGTLSEGDEITFSRPQAPLPEATLQDVARNVESTIAILHLVGAASILVESLKEVNQQRGKCVLCGASPTAPHTDMCPLGRFLTIRYRSHFISEEDDIHHE